MNAKISRKTKLIVKSLSHLLQFVGQQGEGQVLAEAHFCLFIKVITDHFQVCMFRQEFDGALQVADPLNALSQE